MVNTGYACSRIRYFRKYLGLRRMKLQKNETRFAKEEIHGLQLDIVADRSERICSQNRRTDGQVAQIPVPGGRDGFLRQLSRLESHQQISETLSTTDHISDEASRKFTVDLVWKPTEQVYKFFVYCKYVDKEETRIDNLTKKGILLEVQNNSVMKKKNNSAFYSLTKPTAKVEKKIFGAKKDEVIGERRKLHNTELHALYSSPDISRNAYRVLVGRPEGKRPLGRPRRRWEDNIKIDLRELGYDDRDWINLAQDMDR
ncbi:hypothetical protein ANN_16861 [Periplaneta americana]|uniref:Uncharacterized protein n=1 Tax=Periplaneta americana TaxID=6978 RepID=A0ABQ8SSE6_PERAM|nr:hypothetical protein ANN_16861 [Periplaneta americana]